MKLFRLLIIISILISCSSKRACLPTDIKQLILIKSQEILARQNKQIWNLHGIDTNDIKIYKGCFTKLNDSYLFISVKCDAGLSSGSSNRLNLLAHYKDSFMVDYFEQGALPDTILDFNNDGLDDLYFNSGSTWIGSCFDNYNIISFPNGKLKVLFNRSDESVLDCGGDYAETMKKLGDTLLISRSLKFIRLNDKRYEIVMNTEFKIHNGGKTEQEIKDSIKIVNDIDTIILKK